MKRSIAIISLICFMSCKTIVRNSKPGLLHSILSSSISTDEALSNKCLVESDKEMLTNFRNISSDNSDTLKMFNEGVYLMRLYNKDSVHYVEKRNGAINGNKINLVDYELNNSISPWAADKIQYFVFLDDERVVFYSPKQKIKIKTGEKNIENLTFTDDRNFVRKTSNFIKLGSDKDFITLKKGYYRKSNGLLYIILEHGNKKGKISLIGFKFSFDKESQTITAKDIHFGNLTPDSDYVKRFAYKFYQVPNKLMLINKNTPLIVNKITTKSDSIIYSYQSIINKKEMNDIVESKKLKFTY